MASDLETLDCYQVEDRVYLLQRVKPVDQRAHGDRDERGRGPCSIAAERYLGQGKADGQPGVDYDALERW